MKRSLAILLAFILSISALAAPAALAATTVSARTPLYDADDAKLANIELAIRAINGRVISYGESFSFNEAVGPRTKAYGYREAANGRGAIVTGGGVAQAATTLYLALLEIEGGVVFDELETYGSRFRDSYVDDGELAVITDYSADMDFVFTNYSDDMTIEMWMTDAYLYCTITQDGSAQAAVKSSYLNWNAAQDFSGMQVLLGSASIELAEDDALLNNIELAAASINDTTLPAGALFSFNSIVGPRTEKYGYQTAINGRGVKVVGGGVAQVASAVWLAAKQVGGIAVVEKSTYGDRYNQDYVANSNDAILTDYNAGTDFSFRNVSSATITIETYVLENILYCNIYQN